MTQIILGLLKAFPAIAKLVGKAVDFYREAEAAKKYESKLTNIDSAINSHHLRLQSSEAKHKDVDGET